MNKKEILRRILEKPTRLSEDQKEAVLCKKRYVRVIAGPGTGKTETLTRRILYLLLYKNVKPKKIVAFTFTDMAAQNMKSKIYKRLMELHGQRACVQFDEMYIGTIHGFCLKVLQDLFYYANYEVLDESQEVAFIMRKGHELGLSSKNYIKDFIRSLNVVYNEFLDIDNIKEEPVQYNDSLNEDRFSFREALQKYESILDKNKLLTFGRMVALAVQKLKSNPKKISFIKHLLVDEYQDINKTQKELIEIIGKNASVFVVGDPRQNIYRWRGSDEVYFKNFPKHFNRNVKTIQLIVNRRSARTIVESANNFAENFETRYAPLQPKRKEEGKVVKIESDTAEEEAERIASEIEACVKNSKCKFKFNDFAILLRSVKTSGGPFINCFKRKNIPYIIGGKAGLFMREEAQAIGQLFCWLSDYGFWLEDPNNRNKKIIRDALLDNGIRLWSQSTQIDISNKKEELIKWKNTIKNNNSSINLIDMFYDLLAILEYKRLDPKNKMHAAIMANIGRFSNLLKDFESSVKLGGNLFCKSDIHELCHYINYYAMDLYAEQPSEDLKNIEAVQIFTIHQAKGLEWPIVFIPALISKRFPSSMAGSKMRWFISEKLFDSKKYEGGEEDEKRLFYVAITRAKDFLCLSYFRRFPNGKNTTPSKFILMLESSPLEPKVPILKNHFDFSKIKPTSSFSDQELQIFSTTQILAYLKCPYFYNLREIWRYSSPLVMLLGYGKSLHYCFRYASELIVTRKMKVEEAVEKSVEEHFNLPYANAEKKEELKSSVKELLVKFIKDHKEDITKTKEVEIRLTFPVQKTIVVGRADAILKEKNALEVRDYKTSDTVIPNKLGVLQVQLYAFGLKFLRKPIKYGSLVYFDKNFLKEVDVGKSKIDNAKKIAEECISNIIENNFNAKPIKSFCQKCDYSKICKWYNPSKKRKK